MGSTLAVVGEKWSLYRVRDRFLDGPQRFQDLQHSLNGIAPNTLSALLKTLEHHGIVERRIYSEHPPRSEYLLTTKGRGLGPVVQALRDWGRRPTNASG